jgi:hypothetical protein
MYDAWAVYDSTALAVYTRDEGLSVLVPNNQKNLETSVSYAAFRVMLDVFPGRADQLTAKFSELGYDPNITDADVQTAAGVGNLVAANLLAQRHNDGSNQSGAYADTTGYTPVNTSNQVNDVNRWQPQIFKFLDGSTRTPGFLTPHWGQVTPFALASGSEFRCPDPVFSGQPEFWHQAEIVLEQQRNLNDVTKSIAEYWADGPNSELPPGHWILMAKHLARRNNLSLLNQLKMYMLVGNAVMDGGIACWDSKRAHDYVRPITAIRTLYAGKQILAWGGPGAGMVTMDGSEWRPYQPDSFITPPFPELPSGHSTFSASAGLVLQRFFGSDELGVGVLIAAGSSRVEPGISPSKDIYLSYPTISSAVQAAGSSRLYGGIHFPFGDTEGRKLGGLVGNKVFEKASRLFNGSR